MSDNAQNVNTPAPALTLGAVLAKTVAPDAWVEYKEGIFFHFKYMTKARFQSLAEDCTEHKWDTIAKVRKPRLDAERFLKKFLNESVLGWRGVTVKSLSRIVEIDTSAYTPAELETELPFSADEVVKLINMVYELDPFIQSAVTDIKTFRPALEDELKN